MKKRHCKNITLQLTLLLLLPLQFGCGKTKLKLQETALNPEKSTKEEESNNEETILSVPVAFEGLLTADKKGIDPSKVNNEVTIQVGGKEQKMHAFAAAALVGNKELLDAMLTTNKVNIGKADKVYGGLLHKILSNNTLILKEKLTFLESLLDKNAVVTKTVAGRANNKNRKKLTLLHRITQCCQSEEEAKKLVNILLTARDTRLNLNQEDQQEDGTKGVPSYVSMVEKYPEAAKLVIEQMTAAQAQESHKRVQNNEFQNVTTNREVLHQAITKKYDDFFGLEGSFEHVTFGE